LFPAKLHVALTDLAFGNRPRYNQSVADPEKSIVTEKEKPAPSMAARLAWWFGIYFAGSVPFIVRMYSNDSVGATPLESLTFSFFFGLGLWFYGGFIYAFHLLATLQAKTRHSFDLLLTMLVMLVLLTQWLISRLPPMQG
jgi:hypothetical protein